MDRGRLAAYLDGGLEPEEAASVVMHLADDPESRRYVELLDGLNAMLAAAYARPLAEPVPERIRRIVAPSTVVSFPARGRLWRTGGLAFAAAASVLLVAGMLGRGEVSDAFGIPGLGQVGPGSELHAALETSPSGQVVNFPDGDEVTLIATFVDGQDRPCREFELRHGTDTAFSRGIACRAAEGDWSIAVIVSEPSLAAIGSESGYVPASGAADAALSRALDVLGAGMSLTPDAERAAIASGWSGD